MNKKCCNIFSDSDFSSRLPLPSPSVPLPLSTNMNVMQIQRRGHRAKLFAAWPTVNFPSWQALLHCLLPVSRGLSVPPPPTDTLSLSLNHPAVPAPHQRGFVSLRLPLRVCLSSSSLSWLLSSSSSVFGVRFTTCPCSESSLSPGTTRPPRSDTMNVLSPPDTQMAWRTFPVLCVCVPCTCMFVWVDTFIHGYIRIDSWCHRLHLTGRVKECIQNPEHVFVFEHETAKIAWRNFFFFFLHQFQMGSTDS